MKRHWIHKRRVGQAKRSPTKNTVRACMVGLRFACSTLLLLWCAAAFAEPAASVLEAETHRVAVMEKAKLCVLAVFSPDGQGGGSGVVISPDGYALTNFHVVMPCGRWMQCGMADGKVYDAVLVGIDPTGDVAMIKLFGRDDFPCAELGDSDRLRAGDWAFVMGNPFLLATDFQPTISYGIISAVHRYQFPAGTLLEYADCIQTDAAINPGNSGGPLFDAEGRLIGINGRGSFEKRGRVNVGAGYAISINQIKNFLGTLRGGRVADHATLGARVDFDAGGRVVVTDILETSDAFRRGLRLDDEIVGFAGRTISTPNGFKNALGVFPRDWRVPLSYRRDGKRYDVLVRLAGVHGEEELLEKASVKKQPSIMPTPKPGDDPKKPAPKGKMKTTGEKLPVPEIVNRHFQEKHGFANYFFNAQNQQRVWKAWTRGAELDGGVWTLSGQVENGGEFVIRIDGAGASMRLPSSELNWTAGDELGASPAPPHSGGLFPALYLWRRMAVEGLSRFGDVRYDGQAPLAGRPGLFDVLAASHKGAESRFYFDPTSGDLAALEFFSAEDSDPCEVYFHDYRESEGRRRPGRIEVRFGDEPFAAFKIDAMKTEKRGGENGK